MEIIMCFLECKCISIFQHHCAVAGKRENRILPVPVSIKSFVVNKIEVVAFTRVVAKPDICENCINSAVILDKRCG